MGEVNLVAASGQSNVGGSLNIVSVTAQQPDQLGIDAVVVDVQPHNPSLTALFGSKRLRSAGGPDSGVIHANRLVQERLLTMILAEFGRIALAIRNRFPNRFQRHIEVLRELFALCELPSHS